MAKQARRVYATLAQDEIDSALDEIKESLASGNRDAAMALLETVVASVANGPLESAKRGVDLDQDYENDPGFTIEGGLEDELEEDRENRLPSGPPDEGEEDAEHPIVKRITDRIRDVIDAVEDEMGLGREFGSKKTADDDWDEDEPNVFEGELNQEEDSLKDVFESKDAEDDEEEEAAGRRKRRKARKDAKRGKQAAKAAAIDRDVEDTEDAEDEGDEDEEADEAKAAKRPKGHPKGCMCEACKAARRAARAAEDPDDEADDDVGRDEKPMDGDDEGDPAEDVTEEQIDKHRTRKHGKAKESRKRGRAAKRRRSEESLADEMEVEREDRLPSEHFDDDEYDFEDVKTAPLAEKKFKELFRTEQRRRKRAEERAQKAEAALAKIFRQVQAHRRLNELLEAGVRIPENRLDRVIAKLAYMDEDAYADYYADLTEAAKQARRGATASRSVPLQAIANERKPQSDYSDVGKMLVAYMRSKQFES